MIPAADGEEVRAGASARRVWSSAALALLVLIAFVVASRRDGSTGAPDASVLATHADTRESPDARRGPDDTVRLGTGRSTTRAGTSATGVPSSTPPAAEAQEPADPAPAAAAGPTATDGPVGAAAEANGDTTGTTTPAAIVPDTETMPSAPPPTDPVLVAREIPALPALLPPAPPPPWASSTRTTGAGLVATDVGCAAGTSAVALDGFFRERVGPVLGLDYQHVYPLGGGRSLWLFQDTFVDHSGSGARLDQAAFVHNSAMVQDGSCFTLHHRGSPTAPESFEPGTGERRLATWFWPMGGEVLDGQLFVFWAEMQKDGYEPRPGDGLGWHPAHTWLAVYDARTLARLAFQRAPDSGVTPIYGYAVATEGAYTYLFGNTFEQNLAREGGFRNGPHSGTEMYLARVPRGQFGSAPEYRAGSEWTTDPGAARPIVQRFWAENPMQPRHLGGQWVAATKVDGYWGERLAIDVANDPWGPWTTTALHPLSPRNSDPLMNTYHAHLVPWLDRGRLIVSISQNARNMTRDAWPAPHRYRLAFAQATLVAPAPDEPIGQETTTVEELAATPSTTTTPEPSGSGPTASDSPSTTGAAAPTSPTTAAPNDAASTTTSASTSTTTTPPPSSPPAHSTSTTAQGAGSPTASATTSPAPPTTLGGATTTETLRSPGTDTMPSSTTVAPAGGAP